MSLVAGLLALQSSDRLDGLLACWVLWDRSCHPGRPTPHTRFLIIPWDLKAACGKAMATTTSKPGVSRAHTNGLSYFHPCGWVWQVFKHQQQASIRHQVASIKQQVLRKWALDSGKKLRHLVFSELQFPMRNVVSYEGVCGKIKRIYDLW